MVPCKSIYSAGDVSQVRLMPDRYPGQSSSGKTGTPMNMKKKKIDNLLAMKYRDPISRIVGTYEKRPTIPEV